MPSDVLSFKFNKVGINVSEIMISEKKSPGMIRYYGLYYAIKNNYLILFPSWLTHSVKPNKEATIDRISLAFNTFVKGNLGKRENLNHLILR